MTAIGCIAPLPADSNASVRSPSSVPVRMCAVVSDPRRMLPLIVNVTRASPLRNFKADTVPTFIPDTVTGLVHDNESKLAPTLEKLNSVLAMLEKNRDNISKALPGLAKFEITVGEAISNMYAYSAFVPNFLVPQLFQPFFDYLWGFRTFDTARGPGFPSPVPRSLIPWPYNGIPVCPGCTLGGRIGGSQ